MWLISRVPLLLVVNILYTTTRADEPAGACSHGPTSCSCNCGGGSELLSEVISVRERLNGLEQGLCGQEAIKDCSDIPAAEARNGVHQLSPKGSDPFDALCVFDSDGKWTVIQQRLNGNTYFNRIFVEYQNGFGTIGASNNFWLGLEHMHQMTKQKQYTLRIDLTDWDDSVHYAEYSFFLIGDETSKYAITLKEHSGDLPDALIANSRGTPFTSWDQDNDSHATLNCAANYQTGWWHTTCYSGQLNGPYRTPPNNAQGDHKGITWHPYNGEWYSMKASRMRIKPTYED